MKSDYGQLGWKEFNRNRKDILNEYDKILEQITNRPVKVAHGIGVEAYIRNWLEEFLPKKFGVTSGYIIPDLYGNDQKIYHYDIIIYNKLDSPILWVESNQDNSDQGKYRAIPAKFILAIYEVKSTLNKKNVKNSLNKLNEITDFNIQLPKNFHCGIIYIELKEKENYKDSIIKEILKGSDIYGFIGGLILRYEGDTTVTGKFDIIPYISDSKNNNDKQVLKPLAKSIDDLDIYRNEEGNIIFSGYGTGGNLVQTNSNHYNISKSYGIIYREQEISVHLSWSRSHFSNFCIQLINSLEGLKYNDENKTSFGQFFDKIEKKKAPLQSNKKDKNKPFLIVRIYEGEKEEYQTKVKKKGGNIEILFFIVTENLGDKNVIISDDGFKTSLALPKGKNAIKKFDFLITLKDKKMKPSEITGKEFIFNYRLVYYFKNSKSLKKEFYAIEKQLTFISGKLQFIN